MTATHGRPPSPDETRETHNELVTAIDRALNSQEFTQLQPEQREAYSDTALVVKEEVSKAQPDVGKLQRWGGRLVDLGKDVGMSIAVVTGSRLDLINAAPAGRRLALAGQ